MYSFHDTADMSAEADQVNSILPAYNAYSAKEAARESEAGLVEEQEIFSKAVNPRIHFFFL